MTLHLFGPVDGKLGYELFVDNPDRLGDLGTVDTLMSNDTIPDWAMPSQTYIDFVRGKHSWMIRIGNEAREDSIGINFDRKAVFRGRRILDCPMPVGTNVYTNGVVSDVILGWR